jgi:predicted permease
VDVRSRSDLFESVMAHTFSTVGISDSQSTSIPRQTFAAIVSANYFSTLGVKMARGRAFTLDEERPGANARIAIASYAVWRRGGFDPAFVGSTIRANGADYMVIGVAPRGFAGTMTLISPEWWFPLGSFDIVVNEMFKQRNTGLTDRGHYALNLAAALRPGVTRAAAEKALDAFGRQLDAAYPSTDKDQTFALSGLPRMSVSSRPQGDGPISAAGVLLMFMAALVLVVACLNLANLLLARGATRRREIAIRQALGSGRGRIIQQLLVEGFTLSIAGGAAGLVIGWWATGALSAWLSSVLPLGLEVVVESSARLVAASAGFALFSTLCFALGPAWSLSRPTVQSDLKGDLGSTARIARRFGTAPILVVGQLAVSLALVAAGGLFVRAALMAGQADPGFSLVRHLIVSLDPSMAGYDAARTTSFFRAALERVRSLPGVEHASLASIVPFGEFEEGRQVRLKPSDDGVAADFNIVGSEYFETLGMHVLRGREFTRAEEQAGSPAASVIIDRPLARKLFKDGDPIDQPILVSGREGEPAQTRTIVGVVSEMKHDMFDIQPKPHVFIPSGSTFRAMMTIHVRTAAGAPDAPMLATLRRELQSLDARLPILSAKTMADHRYRSLTEWSVRAAATLFSAFGGLALLLATIGVYGLKAYDVARRTREIGIRIALGATSGDVKRLMLREGLRTTIAGVAIGLLLAAGLGKLVSGLLYQVSPFDPFALSAAAATLALAALAASYIPARRATRVEPLHALRSE